jgi:hypothetical protein
VSRLPNRKLSLGDVMMISHAGLRSILAVEGKRSYPHRCRNGDKILVPRSRNVQPTIAARSPLTVCQTLRTRAVRRAALARYAQDLVYAFAIGPSLTGCQHFAGQQPGEFHELAFGTGANGDLILYLRDPNATHPNSEQRSAPRIFRSPKTAQELTPQAA